jgi:phage shock protein A
MNIFQRISDILSANLNDWAEQFEEPDVMLRQAIREMEAAIEESTEQTAKVMAHEKLLAKELDRNRGERDQWQSRAESAVAAGDDDLARGAITRKNEYSTLIDALTDQIQSTHESSQSLQRQLAAMKAKLAEANRNLVTLSARKRAADFRKKLDRQSIGATNSLDESAFAKFERLQAKVEQAEAEAAAMAELRGAPCKSNSSSRTEASSVSAELAAMKRKIGK